MTEHYQSDQLVATEAGVQYHLGTGPGDVAPMVILVGDPARAQKVAAHFDAIELRRANREYVTITGSYRGAALTVTATGIGCDNTEIAIVELCQCVDDPTFIRVGSCGALVDDIALGDLIISTGAVRLESTSTAFVPEGYPAIAHHEVIAALVEATAMRSDRRVHVGLTATASGFYGAQGRSVAGFASRHPDRPAQLGRLGVKNMEMEASALFTLASLQGLRAGAVCAVYADRSAGTFVDSDRRHAAEAACIEAGLGAVLTLHEMDAARGDAPRWRPGLGLG